MNERLEKLLAFHEAAPDDDFTTYAIALEHVKEGAENDALAWLDKTLAIQPDHAYAYYQKAGVLSRMERADDARRAIEDGLAAARRAGDGKAEGELNELLEDL